MDNLWRIKMNERLTAYGTVVPIPANLRAGHGEGSMLISRPLDVQAAVNAIPEGQVVTLAMLMAKLAETAGADTTDPMTTGIFMRIVAEVAELDGADGQPMAPYWRVLRNKGKLNPKYPGGAVSQAKRLEAEGHTITRNTHGAPAAVADFEAKRFALEGLGA